MNVINNILKSALQGKKSIEISIGFYEQVMNDAGVSKHWYMKKVSQSA